MLIYEHALRHDRYFVQSYSQATSGVWIAGRPVFKLPLDVDSDALVQAIRESLPASRQGIEHPKDWNAVEQPLPEFAS